MKSLLLLALAAHTALAAARTEDITLRDEKRGKDIECRVHFPDAGDKLPLIVFSHGFGADKTAFGPISQHIADRGYVVVHPSHQDGFGRSGGEATGRGLGALRSSGGLAGLLNNPSQIQSRVADVVAVMDAIPQLTAKVPALAGRVDASRIGVGGHSFGAYTAMLLGGVTADLGGQQARRFSDPRVRCILPISAQGTGQQGLTKSSWAALKLPMLTITGSRDRGAGGQGPEWKKEPFKFSPPGDKHLLVIEGANHVSFGGYGGRANEFTPIVQQACVLFWDAHLKGLPAAAEALRSKSLETAFPGRVTQQSK